VMLLLEEINGFRGDSTGFGRDVLVLERSFAVDANTWIERSDKGSEFGI
jgi:hypothetical protein